jgi:hypothetical protein
MNNLVLTSQETHYFSVTKPSQLMLFEDKVAVYCDNRTEHTDTIRTSQETHVSATKPNRLTVFEKQSLFIVRTTRNTQAHCAEYNFF